jgi:hypothetical protein
MALSLGQLITGGGAFARGQRNAEEAERVSRQNQLALEELNRKNRLRQEMLQAPTPAQQLPGLQLPEALGTRSIVQAPTLPAAAPTPEPSITVNKPPALPLGGQEGLKKIPTLKLTREQWQSLPMEEKVRRFQEFRPRGERGLPGLPIPGAPKNLADLESMLPVSKGPTTRGGARRKPGVAATDAGTLIDRVIGREGGYVNDPNDRGGETKFGISKRANPDVDVANLTKEQAARIYKERYWNAINADQLPANIREIAFDAAVNQGVGWTQNALAQAGNDPQKLLELRAQRYQNTVDDDPSQNKFLTGWMNRLRDVASAASGVASGVASAASGVASGVANAVIPTAQAEPAAAAAPAPATTPPAAGVSRTPAVNTNLPQSAQVILDNPQSVPYAMQIALQQRQEMAQLAGMYQRAGMGQEYMQTRAKVMELDNNMLYLQGMQGLQEFAVTNDPRRLVAVWSAYTNIPLNVQPRSDGRFDVVVNGQRVREGLDRNDLTQMARQSFDAGYREQVQQASAEMGAESFKSQLKVQEEQAKQTAQMIREIAVAQTQGNLAQALEWAKANYGWDIKPTGGGDGTLIIRPPGGSPLVFNPAGRTIEIDGVKVQSMAAYPIAGLPSYGGVNAR